MSLGNTSRRTFVQAVGGGALIATAGCLGDSEVNETLEIGMLMPLSGPVAGAGESYVQGLELGAETLNEEGGINGREIEVITRDDEANPETAVSRAEDLLFEEEVDLLMGIATTPIARAVKPLASDAQVPTFVLGAAETALTRDECDRYMFRTNTTQDVFDGSMSHGVHELLPEDMTRIAGINPDYGAGRAAWEIFIDELESIRPDIEIVTEEWPTFGQGEYEREIRSLIDAEPDVVHTTMFSGSMVAFIQQALEFDFFEQIGEMTMNAPVEVGMAVGDAMPPGISKAPADFSWPPDDEHLPLFVDEYRDEYDTVPLQYALYSRGALTAIRESIETAGSADPEDMIDELEGLSFSSVLPDITIRSEDHQAVYDEVLTGRVGHRDDGIYGFTDYNPVDGEMLTHDVQCQV